MSVHSQIIYSELRGYRPLLLDLYLPERIGRAPVVVWIHGGGFETGDRRDLSVAAPGDTIFTSLVDAGIACASIDYRLCGEAVWPAQCEDVTAAIEFIRSHAGDYGIDADHIGTWGDSAGGLLALMAAFTNPDVKAAVAWYPITDLTAIVDKKDDHSYSAWLGGWPSSMPQRVADASPITHVKSDSPPCLLFHGEQDNLLPATQSERLYKRLIEAGVDADYRTVPNAGHGFANYPGVATVIDESVSFLHANLGVDL